MFKSRRLFASLAALALSCAAFAAEAANARTPAPAPAPVVAAAAQPAPSAPAPADLSATGMAPARKEEEVAAANAELEPSGDPQPGQVDGELGAAVRPIEPAPTHVDARVLADCEFGKPNDLASVPVERVEELEKSFVIDTHPEAVRYAKRLADGEISA